MLKPGGLFGVYDVMLAGAGEIAYPMPWAMTAATSFPETPDAYRALLAAVGFALNATGAICHSKCLVRRRQRQRSMARLRSACIS